MEGTMIGITLKDRERSTLIGEKTRVKDMIQVVKLQKWAGYVARMNNNRWTERNTDGLPYNSKHRKKRPDKRSRDEIKMCWCNPIKNSSK